MAISIEYIELRRHERAASQTRVDLTAGVIGERLAASLADIGDGGAGLLVDRPLSPNRSLVIEGLEGGPRTAQVRWVRRMGDLFRIGVEFQNN